MAYKQRTGPTCPCGDGDQHSLRTSGLCSAMRAGTIDPAEAQKQLGAIRSGNRDDKRRKGENVDAQPVTVQPASEV